METKLILAHGGRVEIALHNIISRGSTHISDENVKPVLLQSQLILKPDNKNIKEVWIERVWGQP